VKDFTSALYLGMTHPSSMLKPWEQLTTGRPLALQVPGRQRQVERALARLVGCEQAFLGPSTLHLFWDLFGMLGGSGMNIYLDAGAYPIARWGVERAAARGLEIHRFSHYRPSSLAQALRKQGAGPPVVVCDGFCPGCGRMAPLRELLALVVSRGGFLVVDDTQALGVLGISPSLTHPFGRGGGGSLQRQGLDRAPVLLVSSLAKGFGVPAAMLGGPARLINQFAAFSETATHCSPASMACISAASQALAINQIRGDLLRQRLARLVRRFRRGLKDLGLSAQTGLFPMQTLQPQPELDAVELHRRLLRLRIRTVLHQARMGKSARLSFLFTAYQQLSDVDAALLALYSARFRSSKYETHLEVKHGSTTA
jgi:8-amino-7-oxononanoate synthase